MDLAALRREYRSQGIEPADLGVDPFAAFDDWFSTYHELAAADANAIVLATADPSTRRPSARTVLLKGVTDQRFVFYTNHTSRKARELAANPQATILCSWVAVSRQIVIEGSVERIDPTASDAYFVTRPRDSQLGAWASDQSSPLADRAQLEAAYSDMERRYEGEEVPRPPHWGGYALSPDRFEFWQGRESRLHDRVEFRLGDQGWSVGRLAP